MLIPSRLGPPPFFWLLGNDLFIAGEPYCIEEVSATGSGYQHATAASAVAEAATPSPVARSGVFVPEVLTTMLPESNA